MINDPNPQQVNFESIFNFRDLGGFRTSEGYKVAWGKLFRSGELRQMTGNDLINLKEKIGLACVIDLRSKYEIEHQGIGLLADSGIKYKNVSLIPDGGNKDTQRERYAGLHNMGEFYIKLARQKQFGQSVIEALEIMAETANQPLVFHCTAGKDRTGILAAIVLSILGVVDEDIVNDYCLSAPYVEFLYNRKKSETQKEENQDNLPEFFWKVAPENMVLFLTALKQEYGSTRQYIKTKGAEQSLIDLLKKNLLT